jgi:hypothetical protein
VKYELDLRKEFYFHYICGGREGGIKDKWITTRSSPTAQTYGAMIKVGVNINLINNIFGVPLRKQI